MRTPFRRQGAALLETPATPPYDLAEINEPAA